MPTTALPHTLPGLRTRGLCPQFNQISLTKLNTKLQCSSLQYTTTQRSDSETPEPSPHLRSDSETRLQSIKYI
jgi:hypothetical protein